MSWLNANESFFMGIAAQDRIDDLRSTIEDDSARAEETGETSRELPAARRARPRCGADRVSRPAGGLAMSQAAVAVIAMGPPLPIRADGDGHLLEALRRRE